MSIVLGRCVWRHHQADHNAAWPHPSGGPAVGDYPLRTPFRLRSVPRAPTMPPAYRRSPSMPQQETDGRPRIVFARKRLEGIEGRDEDQSGNRPLASKVSGRAGADAQPDSHDPVRRKGGNHVIVDRKRVLKDRSCAGTSGAGSIATVMKSHDVPVRKDRLEVNGERIGVPGIAPEPQDEGRFAEGRTPPEDGPRKAPPRRRPQARAARPMPGEQLLRGPSPIWGRGANPARARLGRRRAHKTGETGRESSRTGS